MNDILYANYIVYNNRKSDKFTRIRNKKLNSVPSSDS